MKKPASAAIILMAVSTLLVPPGSDAHSWGAPAAACATMKPVGHPRNQADPAAVAPYDIRTEVIEGNQVVVTLVALNSSSPFRGFLLMARDEDGEGDLGHGYFHPPPPDAPYDAPVRRLDCPGMPESCVDPAACSGTSNAVTHADAKDKKAATVGWSPADPAGRSYRFVATVVRRNDADGSIWYESVESLVVTV